MMWVDIAIFLLFFYGINRLLHSVQYHFINITHDKIVLDTIERLEYLGRNA